MRLWIVALFLTILPASAPAEPPRPGTYVVHAIDVGSGLAIFVEGADFTLLYDAGSSDDTALGDRNRVVAYLRAVRPDLRRIDHVILSHPHLDHTSLMRDVLSSYEVLNVWDSGAMYPVCHYQLLLETFSHEVGVIYHHATGQPDPRAVVLGPDRCLGERREARTLTFQHSVPIGPGNVPLGVGASMQVLNADGTANGINLHNSNIVVRLDLGTRRILFPGDAGGGSRRSPSEPPDPGSVEARLLECCAADLRADILVAPHHGAKSGSRAAFLDAVGASTFIVSAGPRQFVRVVLPDVEVLAEYDRRGTVWRTDINDYGCERNPGKIGPDADGRPGGCDNIRISIDETGAITAGYDARAD